MAKRVNYSQKALPRRLFALAFVTLLLSAALAIGKECGVYCAAQIENILCKPASINWERPQDAVSLSGKTGKPILYAVLIGKDKFVKKLQRDFGKAEVANRVNSTFVPVKFEFASIRDVEEAKRSLKSGNEDWDELLFDSSSKLLVVPSALRFSRGVDITSSASALDLHSNFETISRPRYRKFGRDEDDDNPFYAMADQLARMRGEIYDLPTEYSASPECRDYRDISGLFQYFRNAVDMHRFTPLRGTVAWRSAELLSQPVSAKPRLLVVLGVRGYESNNYRKNVLLDRAFANALNIYTLPVLFEYDALKPESIKRLNELQEKYGFKGVPATIFVDKHKDLEPCYITDVEWLKKYLSQGLGYDLFPKTVKR